jgi:hypothetical protein
MNWLLIGAVVPIAALAMALVDSVSRYRKREKEQQELDLVCECCGLPECDGEIWVMRDPFTVQ